MTPEQFIATWKNNPLTERAGAQAHFDDLCDLLGVAKPRDPDNYCFERGARKANGGDGWADVWKRGHFGWENKKPGRDLNAALKQLTDYALQLDNPPLLVVCDRERIVIHTAFTGYPDEPREIRIDDLVEPEKRQLLAWVFTDPEKLRPEKSTAAITAQAAGQFAQLAAAMRGRGCSGDAVAHFLVQCLFCMFAEDEQLLPAGVFSQLLANAGDDADKAARRIEKLFTAMQQRGGEYGDHDIAWFNGGLFKSIAVPPLTAADLHALHRAAADMDWRAHIDALELGLQPEITMQTGPHNILGLEINEFAAELARVTVWIGDIQWCRRNGYPHALNPILKPLDGIEHRDALLNPDGSEAEWPAADVIVGNPPFLGDKVMRSELGASYVETLRKTYDGRVPGGADLVTYWFEKARAQIKAGKLQGAGLVSTNSIRGGANRKVLERIVGTTRIFEAWSDEEWVNDGAAVRVSLLGFGPIFPVDRGSRLDGEEVAAIHADLTAAVGVDLTKARPLPENANTAYLGIQKTGPFDLPGEVGRSWLGQPNPNGRPNSEIVKPWFNGLDITRRQRDMWIVDFGTDMPEAEASLYELPFAYTKEHVQPTRVGNSVSDTSETWWLFHRPRPLMRKATKNLPRFIVTPEVSKHRVFAWMSPPTVPDKNLTITTRADDLTFGILHSRFHELWSLRLGTSLEDRPRYTPTTTFETFPFPAGMTPRDTAPKAGQATPPCMAGDILAENIAAAARRLNELREAWLNPPEWVDWVITPEEEKAGFPKRPVAKPGHEADLKKRTLTNLYNARPAWLDMAHKALDQAVAAAYDWPDYSADMPDEEILRRLLALNLERAAG